MNAEHGVQATRIGFVGPLAASFADAVKARLSDPCEFVFTDEANVTALLPDLDVLVTLVFTPAMGVAATRLRLVQVPGAGLDRIDRAAVPAGAVLANAYGHETGIAEYILGAMLALTRSFGRLDGSLRGGRWESQWAPGTPPPAWPELRGKVLGIVGYGRIGQAVARRARAFEMAVWAIRRDATRSAEGLAFLGAPDALDTVLREADYLVLTLPLTPDTRGLLGERELALLKPGAILVNVARAELIDQAALYRLLAEGRIGGAALDVWYRYPKGAGSTPPADHPFHTLSNVLMTPHIAGWTEGTLNERAQVIADNVQRTADGERPLNWIPTRD